MHYKNGRPAANGDAVIFRNYAGIIVVGILHSTIANANTCNGTVAITVPGGVQQHSVTTGEIFHAEDAFAALENPKEKPAEVQPELPAENNVVELPKAEQPPQVEQPPEVQTSEVQPAQAETVTDQADPHSLGN